MFKTQKRLESIISNAYTLALKVQDETKDDYIRELSEEVSGETAEFLALMNNDFGAFGDDSCIDQELLELVDRLKGDDGKQ